jgi:phospholipid/cholesterol/gamma-HCH transport system substrate-binding protein
VTLVVMALLLGGSFQIKRFTQHTFGISAQFSDAAGVSAGAPVRVAGVQVGTVTKVTADRVHGLVIVNLAVNRGVRLGPTTRAEVALATLLGAKYVRLAGDVREPILKSGAVIPNERTSTPYDIFELAKIGTHKIEDTHNENLNLLIKQLATITTGKEESIHQLIDGVADLSTAIAERDAQFADLVDRAETLSNTLATKDQTLASLLDQSDGILKVLANRHDQVAEGIKQAAMALGQLAGVVQTHKGEIDSILDTLHPAVDIIEKHQGDVDRSLAWLGEGAYGLSLAASHGAWADVFIRSLGPDVIGLLGALAGGGNP